MMPSLSELWVLVRIEPLWKRVACGLTLTACLISRTVSNLSFSADWDASIHWTCV